MKNLVFLIGILWSASVSELKSQGCSAVTISVSPSPASSPKKDTTVCKGSALNLSVNIPTTRSTTSYTVTTIPHVDTLPCESTGSLVAGAGITIDDGYSAIQNIGFNFCFFGTPQSQMQICDNGFLTFSTNKPVLSVYTAPFLTRRLPLSAHPNLASGSTTLPPNSILGAWMDTYLDATGSNPGGGTITTQLVGTAPFRAYIVKWNNCRYFISSCRSNTSMVLNMKIVLYETTNLIDIYIKTKPICTLSSTNLRYAATQGLQGDSLFKFILTPGRDSSLWDGANTAVRYTPNGTVNTNSVQWTLNGSTISTAAVANITVTNDTANYVAQVSINQPCPSGSITARDTIKVYGLNNSVQRFNVFDTIRCQGSINLNSQNTGVLTYRWDNGSTSAARSVSNPGIYYVVRTYTALGCTRDTVFYNVVKFNYPKIDSIKRTGCFNSLSNGQVRLFISGDTSGWTLGTNPNPSSKVNPILNQTKGTMTYWVRNIGGCKDSITVSHDSMTAIYFKRVNLCQQDSSGLMRLTPVGGYPPYIFNLTGRPPQTRDSFNSIGTGVFTIQVTDANGCAIQRTDTVLPFTNLALSLSIDSVKCFGDSSGRIIATLSGGRSGYSYSLNNGAFQSSGVFNLLKAGTHTIKTKDGANCPIDTTVTIFQNTIILGAVSKQKSCPFNANGSISITASGGGPAYTYRLNSGAFQTSPVFPNVMNGIFNYSIRDRHNCIRTFQDTLLSHSKPKLSLLTVKNLSCFGSNDGKIRVSASLGTMPYTYAWSISGNNDSIVGLSPITYLAFVTDSNSCKDTLSVTITQPDSLRASFGIKHPSCFGFSNGSIKVFPTGGTPPYQYSINASNFSAMDSFTGLNGTNHTVRVRDSQNCMKIYTVSLSAPAPLILALVADSVKCFGGNDGKIQLGGSGGTLPYTYRLNAASYDTSSLKMNLTSGNYSVSIRDLNGCTKDSNIFVPTYSPLIPSRSILDTIRCKNGNDGRVSISASGGNPAYSYSLNGGIFQVSNVFPNLNSGLKILRVRDANNCEVMDSITLANPPGMTSSVSVQRNVTCYGLTNGKAKVTVTGGVPAYTYLWSNGVTLDSNSTLNKNLHYVIITDNKNCRDSVSFTITQPDSLQANLNLYHPLCNQLLGSIKVIPIGGTSPFVYSINGSAFSTTDSFTNLSAQAYSIVITDANLCTKSFQRTLIAPPLLSATYTRDSVRCFGDNSGRIIVQSTGGTGARVIKINSIVNAGDTIKNLAAGNHFVEVIDANNCKVDSMIIIAQYPDLIFSAVKDTVKCYGASTARITLSVSGGAGSFNYSINGSAFGSNNFFANLSAGSYTAKVRDKNLCEKSMTTVVTQIDSMVIIPQLTQNLCFKDSLGKVRFLISGGTPPYLITFNGATKNAADSFIKLPAGTYAYSVRDSNNCIKNGSVVITQPSQIISATIIDSVKCFKQSTGSIIVNASGGTPSYMISFNGQAFAAANTFVNLFAGSYNVKVRDANLCIKDTNVTVRSSDSFYYTRILDSIDCNNANNGRVTMSGFGGKPPYQYSLNGGLFNSNNVISNLTPTNHTIQIRDNYNCTLSLFITLLNPPPILIQLDSNIGNPCFNDSKGVLQTSSSGGRLPHAYIWSNGGTTSKIQNLTSGNYTLTVRDAKNCTKTLTQFVSQPANFNVVDSRSGLKCYGDTDGSLTIAVSGAVSPYTYLWSQGSTNTTISNLTKGIYSVTITDANSCKAIKTYNLTEPDSISFSLNKTNSHCTYSKDGKINIVNLKGGTAPFFTYSWSHGPNTMNVSNLEPLNTYSITITDTNNCQKQASIYVDTLYALRIKLDTLGIPRCPYSKLNLKMIPLNGSNPYQYYLGTTTNNTGDFLNQINQKYTYSITDVFGCIFKDSLDLVPRDTMNLSLIKYPPPCESANIFPMKAVVTGGKPPYNYQWNRAYWSLNDSARFNQTGYYELEVYDSYSCRVMSSFDLIIPDGALHGVIVNKKNLRCFQSQDGRIEIQGRGGYPPYRYLWNTGETNPDLKGLKADTYSVTIVDNDNCKYVLQDTLHEPDSLYFDVQYSDLNCKEDKNGVLTIYPYGGTPAYLYSIDSHHFKTDPHFKGLGIGTYLISVKDDSACVESKSIDIDYIYKISLKLDSLYQIKVGETVNINPELNLTPNPTDYTPRWTPGDGLSCTDCLNTEYSGFENSQLKLQLQYGAGCLADYYTRVVVLGSEKDELFVPNAFSPNAEKFENQTFKAYANGVLRFEMSVFNRWGEKVFQTDDIRQGWDGTYKGEPALKGIYTYTLRLTKLDGIRVVKSGEVNLF